MGEVYRARDTRLGRDVAIKVLSEGTEQNRERLARFDSEARAVTALNTLTGAERDLTYSRVTRQRKLPGVGSVAATTNETRPQSCKTSTRTHFT